MLGEDLKATLQTTNGGAGQHGKRNSHVSQTVSLISNMKEEAAMQSKVVRVRVRVIFFDCVQTRLCERYSQFMVRWCNGLVWPSN